MSRLLASGISAEMARRGSVRSTNRVFVTWIIIVVIFIVVEILTKQGLTSGFQTKKRDSSMDRSLVTPKGEMQSSGPKLFVYSTWLLVSSF